MNSKIDTLFKNLVLIGSTGNGKSTTGNTILGEQAFEESGEMTSCTDELQYADQLELRLRIIDTLGFNDTRFSTSNVDRILKQLTHMVVSWDGSSSNCIDAFILVQQAAPTMKTLVSDLNYLKDLFGSVALKSVVILVIDVNETVKRKSDEAFYYEVSKMDEVNRILSAGKGESFNPKWYVRWDNFNPHPNQLHNLLTACSTLEPYSHEKFIKSADEIKTRIESKIGQAVEQQTKFLREKYKNNTSMCQREISKMKEQYDHELQMRELKLEEAMKNSVDWGEMIKTMGNMMYKSTEKFQEMFRNNEEKTTKYMTMMNEQYQTLTKTMIDLNNDSITKNSQMFAQLIETMNNREPPRVKKSGGGFFKTIGRVFEKVANKFIDKIIP